MAIIHQAVKGSAESMAKLSGVSGYDFILVDYPWIPTAVWSEEEIQLLAKQVAPMVLSKLTA